MHEFTFYMVEINIEIFTTLMLHIGVFSDVTLCNLVGGYKPYTLKC
jgi:hypothetical protein